MPRVPLQRVERFGQAMSNRGGDAKAVQRDADVRNVVVEFGGHFVEVGMVADHKSATWKLAKEACHAGREA